MLIAIYGVSLRPNPKLWYLGINPAVPIGQLAETPDKFAKLCGLEYLHKQKVIWNPAATLLHFKI